MGEWCWSVPIRRFRTGTAITEEAGDRLFAEGGQKLLQ